MNCPSVYSSSRRYQSRSDLYVGGDVEEGEEELICPFCADEFVIVGLCCHIDEQHPLEAKNGICPVCTKRVGLDIVGHITSQHGNFFKVQRRRRLRRSGYSSAYLTLKKELRESLGGSSTFIPSSNIDSDPLLSSFMFSLPPSLNESAIPTITEGDLVTKVSLKDTLKSDLRQASLSNEDQEKVRKSNFVQGLLWSTMLQDSH